MVRTLKKEAVTRERRGEGENGSGSNRQEAHDRRALRSQYLAVKNLISDEREDITRVDSDKFSSIITQVESLHKFVQKPREQVADAEALLDIANTLVTSVKSQSNGGINPSDFVTALLRNFGQQDGGAVVDNAPNMVSWLDVGVVASDIFKKAPGCCTMVGPMSTEIKQRKPVVQRKRSRPTTSTRPEELDDAEPESKTDTDKNMATMFDILRRKRSVRLENLVLNRTSFAQTVENIFALSFLAKDGRAEISIDDSGHHLVSPKNAPSAAAVSSGDVSYHHFVFRYDFKDWKLMKNTVAHGEELMPHRINRDTCGSSSQSDQVHAESQPASVTPIRKLTRNRGLVIQEEAIVEDSLEKSSPSRQENSLKQKGKRLFSD
ncbi:non-structural maintenance of chromosomes element 4 homolog A-like [Asparagus officinalis]|nr:non-structural maintenance of chromosomes element 4 homolog A-like [Asparagus officinalis]